MDEGIAMEDLHNMSQGDIYTKIKRLEKLNAILDNIQTNYQHISSTITLLETYKRKHHGLQEQLSKEIEATFSNEELKKFNKESQLHMKRKLIEDYKKTESKYFNYIEFQEKINRNYHVTILQRIIDEIF